MSIKVKTFDTRSIDPKTYCPGTEVKKFEVQEFYGIHPKAHRHTMFSVVVYAPTDNDLPEPGDIAEFSDHLFMRTGIVSAVFRFENSSGLPCLYAGIRFLPNKPPVTLAGDAVREKNAPVTNSLMYGVYQSSDIYVETNKAAKLLDDAEELFLGYSESEEQEEDILHFDPTIGQAT